MGSENHTDCLLLKYRIFLCFATDECNNDEKLCCLVEIINNFFMCVRFAVVLPPNE